MFIRKQRFPFVLFIIALCLGSVNTSAQIDSLYLDSLCEFTWRSDINDCPDTIACIWVNEMSTWDGYVFDVPFNITHISREGLEICLEDINITNPVDIIYIMDMSGSMVYNNSSAGDPLRVRDDAIEKAFAYQVNNYPESKAGYVGFGQHLALQSNYGSLSGDHLLPPVTVGTSQAELDNIVTILRNDIDEDCGTTYYDVVLDKAIEWLGDPLLCPHDNKAIIFISDGQPSSGHDAQAAQKTFLRDNNIAVHGVFLGTSMGPALQTLASETGGDSWLVDPNDLDILGNVLVNIVKLLNVEMKSKGLQVDNVSLADGSSGSLVRQPGDDSTWVAVLDKPVALQRGANTISLKATFGEIGNITYDDVLDIGFTINVADSIKYTSECYDCWHRTKISVLDTGTNSILDTLTWENKNYEIRLDYYGPDTTLNEVNVIVKTVTKGDSALITLSNPTFDGAKHTFEGVVPFNVITGNAITTNNETESDYKDLVTLYWQHPVETMDTAYTEVPVSAPPDRIEIHDTPGTPISANRYPTSPNTDTITAGIEIDLYAKVFAETKWLDEYENESILYKDITWNFVNVATGNKDVSIALLRDTSEVAHTTLMPLKAFYSIDLTATLTIAGLNPISETIRFYIKPGDAEMLVIEATNDINKTADLNNAVPWDPIIMPGNLSTLSAYAILRDSLGNWVGPAASESWGVLDADVVTVSNGGGAGEGVINKGTDASGTTRIWSTEHSLTDTVTVTTLPYSITALDIRRKHGADISTIISLSMNQNQDTTLYLYGKRSDNSQWILTPAQWAMAPLRTEPGQNPPTGSDNWFFSPGQTGSGIIWTSLDTLRDTIPYTFTVGPPTFVDFSIITPDSLLIAGQPIEGEVSIRNDDGPVPGLWTYPGSVINPAYYEDIVGSGDPGLKGFIPYGQTTDTADQSLDSAHFNPKLSLEQHFFNGIDTLTFVLYNTGCTAVPGDQNPDKTPDPHQLTVTLGSLAASTNYFDLLPAPLDTIALYPGLIPVLNYSDAPSFTVKGYGYDTYWNYLPHDEFKWNFDATLFDYYPFTTPTPAQGVSMFIDISKASDDQEGWLHVKGMSDTTVTNKIYLRFIGPRPKLLAAKTDDRNGNGFLDRIHLWFDKPFSVPPNYTTSTIIVQQQNTYESVFFTVDSIVKLAYGDDTKFDLYLNEDKFSGSDIPHSSWTPELTINDLDSIDPVSRITCEDGAPPVVWRAVNKIKDTYDHKEDMVTITLSENFKYKNFSDYTKSPKVPADLFSVWTNPSGTFLENESILSGLTQFNGEEKNWIYFKMANNKKLSANHFVNIDNITAELIDESGNVPYSTNQKVRVEIEGDIGDIVVAPIPITPSIYYFNQQKNIPLKPMEPHVIQNMIETQGGIMIQIQIRGIEKAEAKLVVFDAVGNLTFSKKSDDNIIDDLASWQKDLISGENQVTLSFYWSGCTSRGMKAAPGVYRLIVYVMAEEPVKKIIKYVKTVAVRK